SAAQPVLLVAPEPQRHSAVGAELIDDAHLPLRITEGKEPLREELDAHRRAIGLGQFLREQRRNPIAPQQVSHARAGAGPGQQLVLLVRRHGVSLMPDFNSRRVGRVPSLATAAFANELSTTASTLMSFFSISPSPRTKSRSFFS